MTSAQSTTTITGTVYSPLGPNGGDPIPNILVYIPTTALTPFTPDSGVQGGCAAQDALVSGLPALAQATTDAAGHFTLTSTSMPASVNIVIQAGKWRRQYPNTALNLGAINTVTLSMPGVSGPLADLPHIAVVTGFADSIECIFHRIGIADSEVTLPGNGGSISLYEGYEKGGQADPDSTAANPTPSETVLETSTDNAVMNAYDLVMFGCQGTPDDGEVTATSKANLISYANSGGRVFTTHYGYVWLDTNPPFESSADWDPQEFSAPNDTYLTSTIDTSYPEGVILAQWMQNIGALSSISPPQIKFENVRVDQTMVNNPPAQSWAKLIDFSAQGLPSDTKGSYAGNPSIQFTFDTPIGTTGVPTIGITYTNSTTTFLQGDASDSVTIMVTNNSTTATTPGLTLTVGIPGGLTVTAFNGLSTNWVCNPSTLVCTYSAALAPAASDSVRLTFSIASNATLGQTSITSSLSGGGLSNTGQCGRVLFNDYHVETAATKGDLYPVDCQSGALTAQEKFLEFSLYNLSNFVSPSTNDIFVIQAVPIITWPTPAAITYGTPLSGAQLDATANVPGTFVYNPPSGTILDAGNQTLSATFTPTDNVDYTTATANVLLQVNKAASQTNITSLMTPIYYGQEIGFTNGVDAIVAAMPLDPTVPDTVGGGTLSVYVDGVDVCDLIAGSYGAGGTPVRCPDSGFQGFNAGQHTIQVVYGGNQDFLPSAQANSPTYIVTILPDNTSTTLGSSANPSDLGDSVNFTATVANIATFSDMPRPVPVGTVSFYADGALLNSAPITAQGTASVTAAPLALGSHSITASYAATLDFNASGGAFTQVVIIPPPVPLPTVTSLTSSVNPSVVGQSVTFTASSLTTGPTVYIPTGSMIFIIDGQPVATLPLDSRGQAAYTTAPAALTAGTHTVLAGYTGSTNANMAASTSAPFLQQVNPSLGIIPPGFLMTVTPTTFTLGVGNPLVATVTVTEVNGYAEPVKLSCNGLPTETTCAFDNADMTSAGGTTRLVITAAAPHNCGSSAGYFVAGFESRFLPLLSVVVLAFFARRRRALKGLVLAAALCILPSLSGCGIGNCTDLGTRPGTYSFTVTGTSTGTSPITKTQTMNMTVTI